ncbi:MAG TPA: hypothetical protein VK034_08245 [Enhygromyxa sp.]|nr:hypothetical protein [Enhygromyxa sp.]
MNRPWTTHEQQVGEARNEREAWLHAEFTPCADGSRALVIGELPAAAGHLRLQVRCRHIRALVTYDYRRGPGWADGTLDALELAADPRPSTILQPIALRAALADAARDLRPPRDGLTGDDLDWARLTLAEAARKALWALLELSKLGAAEARHSDHDARLRWLAQQVAAFGRPLPERLASLAGGDAVERPDLDFDREPRGFDVAGWLVEALHEPARLASAAPAGLPPGNREMMLATVEPALQQLATGVEQARARATAIATLRGDTDDRGFELDEWLRRTGLVDAITDFLVLALDQRPLDPGGFDDRVMPLLFDLFVDLGYYHRVLDRAARCQRELAHLREPELAQVGDAVELIRDSRQWPIWTLQAHELDRARQLERALERVEATRSS